MSNNFKGIIKLTKDQYNTLSSEGSITVGEQTITYDPTTTLYCTKDKILLEDSTVDTSKFVTTDTEQTISGVKAFTGNNLTTNVGLQSNYHGIDFIGNYGISMTNEGSVSIGGKFANGFGGNKFITIGGYSYTIGAQGGNNIWIGSGGCPQQTAQDTLTIGFDAKTTVNNAIQLGKGTNTTKNSLQVYSYQLLDLSTGKIPKDRLPDDIGLNLTNSEFVSNDTEDYWKLKNDKTIGLQSSDGLRYINIGPFAGFEETDSSAVSLGDFSTSLPSYIYVNKNRLIAQSQNKSINIDADNILISGSDKPIKFTTSDNVYINDKKILTEGDIAGGDFEIATATSYVSLLSLLREDNVQYLSLKLKSSSSPYIPYGCLTVNKDAEGKMSFTTTTISVNSSIKNSNMIFTKGGKNSYGYNVYYGFIDNCILKINSGSTYFQIHASGLAGFEPEAIDDGFKIYGFKYGTINNSDIDFANTYVVRRKTS